VDGSDRGRITVWLMDGSSRLPPVYLTCPADRLDAWLEEGNRTPERGRWQEVAAELGVSREALYRELALRRKQGHAV
jgi:hypothetical protein